MSPLNKCDRNASLNIIDDKKETIDARTQLANKLFVRIHSQCTSESDTDQMRPRTALENSHWNDFTSSFLGRWLSILGRYIYIVWFYINKFLVEKMQQSISPALGAIYGMLFLEGHIICKAVWYTFKKYRNSPEFYGLNQWNETGNPRRPVLLIHGAVGSWSYLGDLAVALKNAHISVFVIDLGFGLPTEEMRKKIFKKIEEIRKLYPEPDQKLENKSNVGHIEKQSLYTIPEETSSVKLTGMNSTDEITRTATSSHLIPPVDIVAHSNGGNIALYSAFTEDCSIIDEQGSLIFRAELQANPHVGKVITLALPSNRTETNWMREIDKIQYLFNINAKFDALMAYKKCALVDELPSHVEYVHAGHVGIVFHPTLVHQILQFLFK